MGLLKSGSIDPEQHIHLLCVYLVFSRGMLSWTSDRTFIVKDASVLAEISHALWLSKLSRRRVAKFKCHGVDNAERFPG